MDIDKLDDIKNESSNTYHRAIKMKPVAVKDNTCIDFIKEVHDKDPKLQVADHVWTSIFLLRDKIKYTQIGVPVIKKAL